MRGLFSRSDDATTPLRVALVVGIVLLIALLSASIAVGATDHADGWPMFGHDGQNTGHAPSVDLPEDTSWTFDTGSSIHSSPTIANGTVYVGSTSYQLYAIDAATGEEQWTQRPAGTASVDTSPAVINGTVYVPVGFNVYAYDANSGEGLWDTHLGDSYIDSSPAIVDGLLYVTSEDGTVHALDARSGNHEWQFGANHEVETDNSAYPESSPVVHDGTLYVGLFDGYVYALDADSGNAQWEFETGAKVFSSPAIVDGTVYVGSNDDTVYAIDAASGEQEWAFETGAAVRSSPAVVDGTVYVGSDDDTVYAIDAASGEQTWTFETEGDVTGSPAVADGTVYVGSDDDYLYAIDAASGERKWLRPTGGRIRTSPAVADGTIFVSSFDGNVHAMPKSPPPTHEVELRVDGEGEVYPGAGTQTYFEGEIAHISPTASEGWEFVHWAGDLEGDDPYPDVKVTEDMEITAVFERTGGSGAPGTDGSSGGVPLTLIAIGIISALGLIGGALYVKSQ